MGSSARDYYDDMEEEYMQERFADSKKEIESMKDFISNLAPCSKEYENIKWLMSIRDKVIRNRELIKLLG